MSVLWFSRFHGLTLSATDDKPGTNATVSVTGTADLNATAALIGGNGLQVLAAADSYRADAETAVVNRLVGSAAFLFRVQTWGALATIMYIRGAAFGDNLTLLSIGSSGSGNLRFRVNDQGTGESTLDLTAGAIALNTTYMVTVSWDQPNHKRRIRLYDHASGSLLDETEDLVTTFTAPADLVSGGGLRFGENAGQSIQLYIDNAFIGDGYDDEATFKAKRSITSFTQYNPPADGFVTLQFRAA